MAQLEAKAFGFDREAERNLFHLPLSGLDEFPSFLPLFSAKFTLFLACDTRRSSVEGIADFATSALAQGVVYICTWGPDCERVHDIFDETIVEEQLKMATEEYTPSDVMTTWHNDETLEDALSFFLSAANFDGEDTSQCKAALAVSVANKEWAQRIDGVMQAQIPVTARTYIYSGGPDGKMWIRDDFDEPLEEFAEYM